MPAKKLSITLFSAQPEVDLRAGNGDGRRSDTIGTSGVIDRDLSRYYEALRRSRARLRKTFGSNEVAAMMDNFNRVFMAAPSLGAASIPYNLADGIVNGLATKWEFNAEEFMGKIEALSFLDLCAVADAAERFWDAVGRDEEARHQLAFEEKVG